VLISVGAEILRLYLSEVAVRDGDSDLDFPEVQGPHG